MILNYINKDNTYKTINDVLRKKFLISTRLHSKLINNNLVLLNNASTDTRNLININDNISIDFSYEEDNSNIVPTEMKLDIIFEDEWILAVNKPAGIAIHPSTTHFTSSLSNGIKFYFDTIGLKKKIRPINRLDIYTSGITIFAKCEFIQEYFIKQMSINNFKKSYICIVEGLFLEKSGTIDLPIGRNPNSIIERHIDFINGQRSITHYNVLETFSNHNLVECILETGRTHQIRVHMKAISHPLLGDTLYNKESNLISRQALHSHKIEFIHPITNKKIILKSNLPLDFNIDKHKL